MSNRRTSIAGLSGLGSGVTEAMNAIFGRHETPVPDKVPIERVSKVRSKISKAELKKRRQQSKRDRKR